VGKTLLSMGLDVGTSTTQLVITQLTVENHASGFCVPEMEISQRNILYKSPVQLTPLKGHNLVDGERLRKWVDQQYGQAGIHREQLDTGAIIITGETSRKENAQAVLHALSESAGNFVVATAGPDLESALAAKGAGAVDFSKATDKAVLHMDIGGGTSNLALMEDGRITATGCLNVGGRLLKFDETGAITYVSPVLEGIFQGKPGNRPSPAQLEQLADTLVSALEMAAGLRDRTEILDRLWTAESGPMWASTPAACVISFSGGVADCIEQDYGDFAFGDIGPILGRAIRRSRLCRGEYRLGTETIRATVIGAGSHSTQLSGSTVFFRNIPFPLKNLPVVADISALSRLDGPGVLALPGISAAHYDQINTMAKEIAEGWPPQPVLIAMEADMAKALGHALALRVPQDRPILCIDRVRLTEGSYLDVGAPMATAIPVVVKTLILNR
jgi:ethanolamine utilization protein EutA